MATFEHGFDWKNAGSKIKAAWAFASVRAWVLWCPINDSGDWSFRTDAELFLTVRSTSKGGQDGLTGLRTQFGVAHDVNDKLSLSLTYLRQQDFRDNAPDRVGHAPLIGVSYTF